MALLCVSIMVRDEASALEDARAAHKAGADLVEFRVDEFFSGGEEREEKQIARLVSSSPLPCIVTCRSAAEGGAYEGSDEALAGLYQHMTAAGPREHPPKYIDVELAAHGRSAALREAIRAKGPEENPSLLFSVHDPRGRPADLTRRLVALRGSDAAVLKIAYLARSLRDNLELFEILRGQDRPTIALAMGEFGLMSRVLAPKFGAFLTFASLRASEATAPGQPTLQELLEGYRFRSISPRTRVYGVLGHPVSHSLSPLVHNAGFERLGHDGVYLPMPVPAGYESLKATLLELVHDQHLDLAGCSVTAPHKENLVRLASEQGWAIEPFAHRAGAANTLAIEQGRARISNTDAPAAVSCLAEALGDLAGKRVGLVGTGGVARAIAGGLAEAGAIVVISGRSPEKAQALTAALTESFALAAGMIEAVKPEELSRLHCDALVNCTTAGMHDGPASSDIAIPAETLAAHRGVVFETVYNPPQTPLLAAARAKSLPVIDGVRMFTRQAEAQFHTWTGQAPPSDLFESLSRSELNRRQSRCS